MCMHSALIGGEEQKRLLTTALHMRMVDRGYVFIPYDTLLYSLPYEDVEYPALTNDSTLRRAYDGVLTITQDSEDRNFYEAFREAQAKYEIRTSTPPEQVLVLNTHTHTQLKRRNVLQNLLRSQNSKKSHPPPIP